jgi:hypothetical protein
MLFGAAREDWNASGYAELGGFFNRPLHAIKFENGKQQGDRQGWLGCEFFDESEDNFIYADRFDTCAKDAAIRDYVCFHARLCAKDAREMFCLCAEQAGG